MSEPRVIGKATWHKGNSVAELIGLNVWRVTVNGERDYRTERNLTAIYRDRLVYGGPSDGYYGYTVLKDVARMFNGEFSFNAPLYGPNRLTVY